MSAATDSAEAEEAEAATSAAMAVAAAVAAVAVAVAVPAASAAVSAAGGVNGWPPRRDAPALANREARSTTVVGGATVLYGFGGNGKRSSGSGFGAEGALHVQRKLDMLRSRASMQQ